MIAGSWNDPAAFVLLGGVLLMVGVIWARFARAARARRKRDSR